ncbi:ABC transporter permease [Bacillus subtilis subsp. subtilis]|mgnify:FL=1|uniref:Probable ABC transporter permease YtrD n=4 Tax=Bacteria TaxID=2 RepID=YTRD_BACSU|nr:MULTISPECIES: ABC transporter permease YtrD [Bacillales]NP_390921.1 ABC transporter, permease component involved in resistance to cell wall inhibitors [Bacillus subtilis subsp. subtilis str. 168]O34953.1 RecName: Full=Probable ABC transporter permease YtrD [Bacillus subtilis subsp. subtilis str. 168]BAM54293.1 ABC transporter permease [Bacillus subtilis BEST7613]AAC00250.1 YtrD [Bacillus subtilis]AFQ58885.1 ABC transporter, permease component [Bacillus subtilis QB928]AGG62447.1 ABC transpo
MPDSGLLYKEWRQNKVALVITILVFILGNPLSILNMYLIYQGCVTGKENWVGPCVFSVDYLNSSFISLFWIWGVVLAVSQLGIERSKSFFDFTLSLPYTRGQIFHAKFLTGGMVIVVPQLIGYVLSVLLIMLLKPDQAVYFHNYSLGMIIVSMLAYSLVMAGGALTGNSFAQLLVSFTVAISPFLLISLPVINLEILFGGSIDFIHGPVPKWVQYFIPIIYVDSKWAENSPYYLVIPAIMTIIFYIIGYISFVKMSNERNGYFFLWKPLNRPVQIIVIIIGIMGFGYFGFTASESFAGYLIGMGTGAVIGFLISYFAIYKKMKLL